MTTRNTLTQIVAAMILVGAPLFAQTSVRRPAGITHDQADRILQELTQIRQLLSAGAARTATAAPEQQQPPQVAAKANVKIDPNRILGRKDAPVTIVEYTDSQCGFCRQFHANAFVEIRQKLIETGKVRFVSHDLPLDVASVSLRAAEAMRCAGEQGRFWELRETIMSSPGRLTDEKINEQAAAVGVKVLEMQACIASRKYQAAIQKDMNEAASLGVAGTPTFIIGKTTADGVDGVTLVGAQGYAAFEAKVHQFEK